MQPWRADVLKVQLNEYTYSLQLHHELHTCTPGHSPGARRKRSLCTDALANLLSERRKRGVAVHARRARPGKLNARFAKPGTQASTCRYVFIVFSDLSSEFTVTLAESGLSTKNISSTRT